mmetsp:Transcript_20664/g.36711  ORF Transcript_20664/g.36711 Transcript_20664/m.36711 type:complete len:416 (+) Transcript_20664:3-1250(+)
MESIPPDPSSRTLRTRLLGGNGGARRMPKRIFGLATWLGLAMCCGMCVHYCKGGVGKVGSRLGNIVPDTYHVARGTGRSGFDPSARATFATGPRLDDFGRFRSHYSACSRKSAPAPQQRSRTQAKKKQGPSFSGNQRISTEGLVLPPQDENESRSQAVEAVSLYLKDPFWRNAGFKKKDKKAKGFKSGGAMKELMDLSGKTSNRGARMALEMSMGAENALSVAQSALAISQQLPKPMSMRFQDTKTLEEAQKLLSGSGVSLGLLSEPMDSGDKEALVIVGAQGNSLKNVVDLVESQTKKTHILLLNAEFTPMPPSAAKEFISSFDIIYSLLPLDIQGFMGSKKRGAVFRSFQNEKLFLWRAFMEDDKKEGRDRWTPVGSWRVRPNGKQLEDAMYGSGADSNPINKGIQGFRGIFG